MGESRLNHKIRLGRPEYKPVESGTEPFVIKESKTECLQKQESPLENAKIRMMKIKRVFVYKTPP